MGSVPLMSCWFSSYLEYRKIPVWKTIPKSKFQTRWTLLIACSYYHHVFSWLLSRSSLVTILIMIITIIIIKPIRLVNRLCIYTYITFAPDSIHPISISIMNSYRSMLFFAAETEDSFRCHYHLFEQGRVTGLQSTPVRVGWLVPGWNIIY